MMRRKIILLTGSICLCLSGVTYSYWSDAMSISHNVTTGELHYILGSENAVEAVLCSLDGQQSIQCGVVPVMNSGDGYEMTLGLGDMELEAILNQYPRLIIKMKLKSADPSKQLPVQESITICELMMSGGMDTVVWSGNRQIQMEEDGVLVIYDMKVKSESYSVRCNELRENAMQEIQTAMEQERLQKEEEEKKLAIELAQLEQAETESIGEEVQLHKASEEQAIAEPEQPEEASVESEAEIEQPAEGNAETEAELNQSEPEPEQQLIEAVEPEESEIAAVEEPKEAMRPETEMTQQQKNEGNAEEYQQLGVNDVQPELAAPVEPVIPKLMPQYLNDQLCGNLIIPIDQRQIQSPQQLINQTYCYWSQELNINLRINVRTLGAYQAEETKDGENE